MAENIIEVINTISENQEGNNMNNSDLNITTGAVIDGADATVNTGEKVTAAGMKNTSQNALLVQTKSIVKEKTLDTSGICVVPCNEQSMLEQQMPEEDRAVESDEDFDQIEKRWKDTSLLASRNMSWIQGALNSSLYARICEDGRGIGYIEFCQRYENGQFSSIMRMAQSDLFRVQLPHSCTDKKEAKKIKSRAEEEYWGKFKGDFSELLSIDDIFAVLCVAFSALSRQSDKSAEQEKIEFYLETTDIARGLTTQVANDHKSYYTLTDGDIAYVAQYMGIKKNEFLDKLLDYGCLYLVGSSTKYKTNVRTKCSDGTSYTEWCYCLWKPEYRLGISKLPDTKISYNF